MISNKVVVLFVSVFLVSIHVISCGRRKKSTQSTNAVENKTVEIKQGSENQAYEDSVKRVKNELKK